MKSAWTFRAGGLLGLVLIGSLLWPRRGARVPASPPANGKDLRYGVPLKCFAAKGADMTKVTAPFILETTGPADYSLAEVRLGSDAEKVLPCG